MTPTTTTRTADEYRSVGVNPESMAAVVRFHGYESLEEAMAAVLFDHDHGESPDGCTVEPDGTCPHGFYAWPRFLGLI